MTAPEPSTPSGPDEPDDSTDFDRVATRLDRITYLLVALLVVQLVDLLELGLTGLVLFLVVGLARGFTARVSRCFAPRHVRHRAIRLRCGNAEQSPLSPHSTNPH